MHTIDLKNKGFRTDLVVDEINRQKQDKVVSKIIRKEKNITLEEVKINKDVASS